MRLALMSRAPQCGPISMGMITVSFTDQGPVVASER